MYQKERAQDFIERAGKLPRLLLANLPTPLEKAPRLSESLKGPSIYFKRDDLTGMPLSGNKTRMFEFVLGHALESGADAVVSTGAVQSNYCRQLAVAGSKLGLDVYLVLGKVRGEIDLQPQGNFLLELLAGAHVEIFESNNSAEQTDRREEIQKDLLASGRHPFLTQKHIGLHVLAYVNCMIELCEQLESMNIKPDYLYVASNGCTQAGLVLGGKYLGVDFPIVGINPYDTVGKKDASVGIAEAANTAAKILDLDIQVKPSDAVSYSNYVGRGYGQVTQEGIEAIKFVAEKEGVILEPVYTAKAMAALIDHIRREKVKAGEKVVFLHTGGFPSLFAYSNEFEG